jgi:hypothetical protein
MAELSECITQGTLWESDSMVKEEYTTASRVSIWLESNLYGNIEVTLEYVENLNNVLAFERK